MRLLPTDLKIDFMGMSRYWIMLSLLLIAGSVYLWVDMGDLKYSVDYRGGTEVVVKFRESTGAEEVRKNLAAQGVGDPLVQAFEEFNFKSQEFSIRVGESKSGENVKLKIEQALKVNFQDKFEILKSDVVGPTIGEELRKKAFISMIVGLVGILIYVAVRFEFAFALGAVLALFHDVIIATGIYLLCGRQISGAYLAAALTLVGYSVNDTIIIFDRIREEILKSKDFELVEVVNRAINATLSRTIITSLLTLFSAVALLLYGGGAIADLSLFLVVGIVVGSYSTIFIASPIVVMWERLVLSRGEKKRQAVAGAR